MQIISEHVTRLFREMDMQCPSVGRHCLAVAQLVATSTSLTQYSYNGSGMLANPTLSVAGLTGVADIGTRKNDIAALTQQGNVKYWGFTGSSMVEVPDLEINLGVSNPIDLSLFPSTYDAVLLEYKQSGTAMNPAIAITGLNHPVAICASNHSSGTYQGQNLADIIQGNQDNIYAVSSSFFAKTSILLKGHTLVGPSCVAVRPGSYDRIFMD